MGAAGIAQAQDSAGGQQASQRQGPPRIEGWQVDVGVGVIAGPEFLGNESYRVLPIPFIDIRYGENLFFNVPQGLGGYVVNTRSGKFGFKLGAALAPNFSGRSAGDIPGLDTINPAIEGRGYAEFSYGAWSLNLTAAQDVGTGHEGFYSDLELGYSKRIGQRGFGRLSGSVRYADDVYLDSFYRITNADSRATGLDRFNPSSGFESYAVQALYAHAFNRRWRATIIGQARFAVDDARRSPITDTNTAVSFITALTYRF